MTGVRTQHTSKCSIRPAPGGSEDPLYVFDEDEQMDNLQNHPEWFQNGNEVSYVRYGTVVLGRYGVRVDCCHENNWGVGGWGWGWNTDAMSCVMCQPPIYFADLFKIFLKHL